MTPDEMIRHALAGGDSIDDFAQDLYAHSTKAIQSKT